MAGPCLYDLGGREHRFCGTEVGWIALVMVMNGYSPGALTPSVSLYIARVSGGNLDEAVWKGDWPGR